MFTHNINIKYNIQQKYCIIIIEWCVQNMKRKSAIIIAILIMSIGFAAISTTLIINGNVNIGENTDDFSVIFTKASLDGQDIYNNVIDDTRKIITFETNDLKTLNQTSTLSYEVTNNSSNYDAEVSVNCKVKENTTAKYTSIKNELEGNATVVKAKETLNGTLTITLNKTATEEVREEYVCTLTFNAVERNELGRGIPNPVSFTTDSWETIQKAVQTNDTNLYNIGDTKEVDLGSFGTHTVRIANKSTCTNGETSETACGFVVEFVDCISETIMNSNNTNVGSWKASTMRTYLNNTIYSSLPSDLQKVIVSTKVITGHGSAETTNSETQDKLYLLSAKEVWGTAQDDTVNKETRQLDYYKNQGVTATSYAAAIKKYNGSAIFWYLRSPYSGNDSAFIRVGTLGNWSGSGASGSNYVSPAFRIS